MKKEWKINGRYFEHTIVYEADIERKQYNLFIDGIQTTIPKSSFVPLMGVDHAFEVDGETYRILHRGSKVELVVNGILLDRQRKYIPSKLVSAIIVLSILLVICGAILLSLHFNQGKDTYALGLSLTIASVVLSGGLCFML